MQHLVRGLVVEGLVGAMGGARAFAAQFHAGICSVGCISTVIIIRHDVSALILVLAQDMVHATTTTPAMECAV